MFLTFLYGLLAISLHEFLHYITALSLGCNAEFFFDHIAKSNCSKLAIECKSIGLNSAYCLNDFLVSLSAPLMGLVFSLIGLAALYLKNSPSRYFTFLSLLLSFFFLRSSLNYILSDTLTLLGFEDQLRLSDEQRIQLYLGWNPQLFKGIIHLISLGILLIGVKILSFKVWLKLMIPITLATVLLLLTILLWWNLAAAD